MIFGGVVDINSNERTNQIQTSYIEVPSLRQMSWEALNKFTHLRNHSAETLISEGIPSDLIRQLNA